VERVVIGEVVVDIYDEVETLVHRWPDRAEMVASSNPRDPESVARAWALGYHGDTWAMSREHELVHHELAVANGYPWSPTLYCVASGRAGRGECACPQPHWVEEAAVLAVQADRRLRGPEA
jgi:hypothetical protein